MKILFISRFLPHSKARDSGRLDVYNYIVALSKYHHKITLISFVTPDQSKAVTTMETICERVVAVPYYPNAILSRLWRLAWRWLMPKIYGRTFSLRYQRALKHLVAQNDFDIAVVDGMMARYGNLIQVPKILDEVDVYSTVAYQIYSNASHFLYRIRLYWDWLRTLTYELHYLSIYDAIFVRSEKDRLILGDYFPLKKISVLSPWFEGLTELREIEPHRPLEHNLLFVGAMNLPANIEAITYFVEQIFPLIKEKIPDTTLYIVGSNPVPSVQNLNVVEGVTVVGEVKHLAKYYKKCAVNVVPLLRGGGVIVKTLNGLAAARPTVTTPYGISGINAQPGRDLLVADIAEPEVFAKLVVDLLSDGVLWQKLANNGRIWVHQAFNWDEITQEMIKTLVETIVTTKGLLNLEK